LRGLGVPAPLVGWLILQDLDNNTVVRTDPSDDLKGLKDMDFDAKMECGQGAVCSG